MSDKDSRPPEDARVWASSIGSDVIDIKDKVRPGKPRALKAPLVSGENLQRLRALLEGTGDK